VGLMDKKIEFKDDVEEILKIIEKYRIEDIVGRKEKLIKELSKYLVNFLDCICDNCDRVMV